MNTPSATLRLAPNILGPSDPRSRVGRLVMAIAAVAQLLGILAGPLDHSRASTRLGAHIEAAGTTQSHYSHDEATCVACAISAMAVTSPRGPVNVPRRVGGQLAARGDAARLPFGARRTQAAPRAPPMRSLIG